MAPWWPPGVTGASTLSRRSSRLTIKTEDNQRHAGGWHVSLSVVLVYHSVVGAEMDKKRGDVCYRGGKCGKVEMAGCGFQTGKNKNISQWNHTRPMDPCCKYFKRHLSETEDRQRLFTTKISDLDKSNGRVNTTRRRKEEEKEKMKTFSAFKGRTMSSFSFNKCPACLHLKAESALYWLKRSGTANSWQMRKASLTESAISNDLFKKKKVCLKEKNPQIKTDKNPIKTCSMSHWS